MKITFKTMAIAASLCSALVLSPVSFAGCDGAGNKGGFKKGPEYSQQKLEKLTKKLDLTEAQQVQVKALQAENQAKNLALKPAMDAFKEQMKTLMTAETFDEQAFVTLQASNQDVFAAKALNKAKHKHAMKSLLTEEQLEKFTKMIKRKGRK